MKFIEIIQTKKRRRESEPYDHTVETVHAKDDEDGVPGYYSRLLKHLEDGDIQYGEWYPIDEDAFDMEED